MSNTYQVPEVPRVKVAQRAVHTPMKEDLVKQVKRDGARYPRHRYRVVVRDNVNNVSVSGGYVLYPGTHEIVVDESETEALMSRVEDAHAEIESAKKEFERLLLEEADEQQDGRTWREQGADPEEVNKIMRQAAAKTGHSVESVFSRRMGRGIRPIVSCTRLTEQPLPPIEIDSDINVAGVAAAVASVMAQMQQAAPQPAPAPQHQSNGNGNHKR